MPQGLSGEDLANPWVLVGMLFLLTIFGGVVPRWLHKSIVNDKNKELDSWKATSVTQSQQINELIKQSETALHIGEEIKRLAERRGDPG